MSMPQPPLDVLCIEPRYPGRLGGVADWLVRRRGYRVRFYCYQADPPTQWPESTGRGIELVAFNVGGVAREASVDWPRVLERGLCYSYGCWEVLDAHRPRPIDLVLARSNGLGSSLFAPVSYPGIPVVQFFDSYYDPDHDEPGNEDKTQPETYRHWRLAANAIELTELENGVTPWTPTVYQRNLFPSEYRNDFQVIHDGVETRNLPQKNREPLTIGGRTIPKNAKVITFVASSLDRLRGFDRFVRIIDQLTMSEPDLIAIAVGDSVVHHPFDFAHYGHDFPALLRGKTAPTTFDRLWMPGVLPPHDLRRLFARSDLHLYLSRPHPVSRSLVEAMAVGCVILAIESDPVCEFLETGKTGLMVSSDLDEAVNQALMILRDPESYRNLGKAAAAQAIMRYSRDVTGPKLVDLFSQLVNRRG